MIFGQRKLLNAAGFFFLLPVFHASAQTFERPLQKCWFLETPVIQNSEIASDNQYLFLPLPEGIVRSVDLKTNAVSWKSALGGEISGSLLVGKDHLYVATVSQTLETENKTEFKSADENNYLKYLNVSSLSSATGIFRWKTELEISKTSDVYLFDEAEGIYVIAGDGTVYILDKENGKILSKHTLPFRTDFRPLISNQKIYVGDVRGKIVEMFLPRSAGPADTTAKELIEIGETPTAFSLAGADLYVGDKLGKVFKVNISNQKVDWIARTGGAITEITLVDDKLLVSSSDNFVYFLSRSNGSRTWKKRFEGKNQSFAAAENFAFFAPLGDKTLTVIEMKKGRTINRTSLDATGENFFSGKINIFGNVIVASTLEGFYAFAEDGCSRQLPSAE